MWHPKPWRMARGTFIAATAGGTNSFVALYNDGTGAELLALWGIVAAADGTAPIIQTWQARGTVGSLKNKGQPLWGNSGGLAGAIYSGTLASLPTADMYLPGTGGNAPGIAEYTWEHPIAIIDPGWLFGAGHFTQAASDYPTFVWEVVHPEDVYGQPCHICDRLSGKPQGA